MFRALAIVALIGSLLACWAIATALLRLPPEYSDGVPCRSAEESKREGRFFCSIRCQPPSQSLPSGKTISIKEGWVEEATRIYWKFGFIKHRHPLGWYRICLNISEGGDEFYFDTKKAFTFSNSDEVVTSISCHSSKGKRIYGIRLPFRPKGDEQCTIHLGSKGQTIQLTLDECE